MARSWGWPRSPAGTGRFEDASGTLTLEDAQEKLVSFDGVTAVFTGEPTVTGRISY